MKRILYFTAPWCKACVNLKPHLERVSIIIPIETVDVSVDFGRAERLDVSSLPTLILYEDEKIVKRIVGVSEVIINQLYEFAGI